MRDSPVTTDTSAAPELAAEAPHGSAGAGLLQVWLSPAFPVGAFAYSHGLEKAAERGLVTVRGDLEAWLASLFTLGSARVDMSLLAIAHGAVTRCDWPALRAAGDLALALQPSAERYLETTQQGGSFMTAIAAAWPHPGIAGAVTAVDGDLAYPIALAIASALHGIALPETLAAFGIAFTANLVSAAIRLSIVGQTDGQRIVAGLMATIAVAASQAEHASLGEIASATIAADICSLQHETQHTRLFRS